jgi:hypothetical protein
MKKLLSLFKKAEDYSNFNELYDFEHGFNEYYKQNLNLIFEAHEFRRTQYLKLIIHRLKTSLIILSIALFSAIILTVTPLHKLYDTISLGFNSIMSGYNKWWAETSFIFKFLLPSELIIWNFPSPFIIVIILLLILGFRCLFPIFSYRKSIKLFCTLPVFNFMGKCKFNETNIVSTSDYYKALILPIFDEAIFSKGNFELIYKHVVINISELKLMLTSQQNVIFKTPSFIGFMVVCDFKDFNHDITNNIIVTNIYDGFKEKLDNYHQIELKNNFSEQISFFNFHPENYNNSLINNIALDISNYSSIINKHNNNIISWDDKLFNRLMRFIPPIEGIIIDKTMQCSFFDNKVYFMMPFNREIFDKNSLFKPSTNIDDIHLMLASIKMIYSVIDKIKG